MSRSSDAWKPSFDASKLHALAQAPFLAAVRDALPWAFGALVAAFIVLLVVVSPSPTAHGAAIAQRVSLALLPAFGIMACALAIALPLALARRAQYSPAVVLVASLACFTLALPRVSQNEAIAYLRAVGATGIFLAILMTGIVAACIALMRFPRRRDDAVARDVLGAIIALVAVAMLVFAAHVDISQKIASALEPLARMGDTYPAFLAIIAVEMLLWTVGVHGPAMLAAIVTPVYLTLQMQNTSAFAAKLPLPHVVVVSLFLFVFPGGSGATLPLAALLAVSRIPRLRKLGRIVIFPAIANVNEPLIFGLPIVLNPYMLVPFVFVPLVLASVTYAAVTAGLVARPAFYVPSSVPAPISTYLATLDPRAPLLLCANLAIAFLLYLPFVRAYERHLERAQ
jgi:PTS system cellobiose-specific IIC component